MSGMQHCTFLENFLQQLFIVSNPLPFLQSMLYKHQTDYKNYQWEIHPYGLWKEEGELELFTTSVDDFTSISGVMKFPDANKTCKVQVRTLSQFMYERSLNTIDLLKLDCEGAEYEILFFHCQMLNSKK